MVVALGHLLDPAGLFVVDNTYSFEGGLKSQLFHFHVTNHYQKIPFLYIEIIWIQRSD